VEALYYILCVLTGLDVDLNSEATTFYSGETTKIINVLVMCDNIIEGNEKFNITLFVASTSSHLSTKLGLKNAIGIINDSTGSQTFCFVPCSYL